MSFELVACIGMGDGDDEESGDDGDGCCDGGDGAQLCAQWRYSGLGVVAECDKVVERLRPGGAQVLIVCCHSFSLRRRFVSFFESFPRVVSTGKNADA